MTTEDIVGSAAWAVFGLAGGWAVSHFYFRRGPARSKLIMAMREEARVNPETLGLRVQMKVGTQEISNLVVLQISVTNEGPNDLLVSDAEDQRQHGLRARIELPAGLRALADPWNPERSSPRADVRVARQYKAGRQVFYIHVHRLAKGEASLARVVCTHTDNLEDAPLTAEQIGFFPGYLVDVDVQSSDLLKSVKGPLLS